MEDSLSPVEVTPTPSKRRYSVEFKRQVVQESFAPGASIARVAMAHGINANLLHTWRWQYRRDVTNTAELVPVHLSSGSRATDASLPRDRIEVVFESARVIIEGNVNRATLQHVFEQLRS